MSSEKDEAQKAPYKCAIFSCTTTVAGRKAIDMWDRTNLQQQQMTITMRLRGVSRQISFSDHLITADLVANDQFFQRNWLNCRWLLFGVSANLLQVSSSLIIPNRVGSTHLRYIHHFNGWRIHICIYTPDRATERAHMAASIVSGLPYNHHFGLI